MPPSGTLSPNLSLPISSPLLSCSVVPRALPAVTPPSARACQTGPPAPRAVSALARGAPLGVRTGLRRRSCRSGAADHRRSSPGYAWRTPLDAGGGEPRYLPHLQRPASLEEREPSSPRSSPKRSRCPRWIEVPRSREASA